MPSIYLPARTYDRIAAAIAANLPACPWTGGANVEQAKRELGERWDVWPDSIRGDAA